MQNKSQLLVLICLILAGAFCQKGYCLDDDIIPGAKQGKDSPRVKKENKIIFEVGVFESGQTAVKNEDETVKEESKKNQTQ